MAQVKLIDFWAPWCGPCKMMAPILEEIKKEHPEVEIEEVNVDENAELSGKYGVMSIPTYVIEKDGQEVGRKIGMTAKDQLVSLIKSA